MNPDQPGVQSVHELASGGEGSQLGIECLSRSIVRHLNKALFLFQVLFTYVYMTHIQQNEMHSKHIKKMKCLIRYGANQ